MKLLVISPGMNKSYNDNFHVYNFIAQSGHSVLILTQSENINKGERAEVLDRRELYGSLIINRVFRTLSHQKSIVNYFRLSSEVKSLILEYKPDVLVCEELGNIFLSFKIKKEFGVPMVLRTEFVFDDKHPYRVMGGKLRRLRNPIFGDRLAITAGKLLWRWVCRRADHIITCYHDDISNYKFDTPPLTYAPWPSFLPEGSSSSTRKRPIGVFIGAFDRHKNLQELRISIPAILEKTPTERFYFVGTGVDFAVIEELQARFPSRVVHVSSLPREECLTLIRESFFSYSPATRGGWGFIGDSWAVGTPLLVTHDHYGFRDGIDSIVTTADKIWQHVNELYQDPLRYERLASGGLNRYLSSHTSDAVGRKFLDVCNETLTRR